MSNAKILATRLKRSAVVWSWAFNFLRLAAGLLLLPLLLIRLSESDLGMYYVFLRLVALVPIIDFGFSVSIGRNVSYAMGGAERLRAQGLASEASLREPNQRLLWQLLHASQRLYALMAVGAFVLLGAWGTWNVAASVSQTDNPTFTWIAWVTALVAATLELYLGWWNTFLRATDQVVVAARYAVTGYAFQLVLACALLLLGGGLLSLPIGTLVGGLVQRLLSRRACLRLLDDGLQEETTDTWELLKVLWPNSWRVGLQLLSVYLGTTLPALIFASHFSLAMFAPYGVSYQVMAICSGMAMVWLQVKWPLIGQCRARNDMPALRKLLWPRFWLQNATFLFLTASAIVAGPILLEWIGSGKELLPLTWLVMLSAVVFLELQFSFWTTLISTENRIPSLWPTVATQFLTLCIYLGLTLGLWLDYPALVLAPLMAGSLFNFWYWPFRGARGIGTSLIKFLCRQDCV